METIYLDNGTVTKPSPYVIEQMLPFLRRYWHLETAPYVTGKEPISSINRSMAAVKELLKDQEGDQYLITASKNSAIEELLRAIYLQRVIVEGCNHFVTTKVEETGLCSALASWEQAGCVVKELALTCHGQVTGAALREALSPRTALVSLGWAHSLTGVLQPIWELAEICRERGVWLHVDSSSVMGKLHFQWRDLPIDFLTFDAARIHGPRGVGILAMKKDCDLKLSKQDSFNVPALIGLGVAAREAEELFDHMAIEVTRLRDLFEAELIADVGAEALFTKSERVPHIAALRFPGVSGQWLGFYLQREGILANLGGGSVLFLSEVLRHLGKKGAVVHETVSFGFSCLTTEEEVRRAIGVIADGVCHYRKISQGVLS